MKGYQRSEYEDLLCCANCFYSLRIVVYFSNAIL